MRRPPSWSWRPTSTRRTGVQERNRLEDLHTRIESQQQLVQNKAELKETIPGKEEELRQAEAELSEVDGGADRARYKLHNMRAEFDEKRSAQMAYKSGGKVLDALMGQKANGHIPGWLGDLGGIDKKHGKYDGSPGSFPRACPDCLT